MARSRNIKPGFYKNEDLAECSVWARLLFPGLWILADREGRLENRPRRIKGEIFPYESIEVVDLLDELEQWGFIERYSADNKNIITVCRFTDHQTPHGREADSDLPDKNGSYTVHDRHEKTGMVTGKYRLVKASTVQDSCENHSSTVQDSCESTLIPDSLNLIPDSLNLIPDSHYFLTSMNKIYFSFVLLFSFSFSSCG